MREDTRRPGADERSDGDLVRALRAAGDTMAFDVLMRRYERPLYGYIVRQVGDRSHAPDLYQLTLLKLVARLDTCHTPDAFGSWLFGIASNVCKNHRRGLAMRAEGPLDLGVEPVSRAPDPEQAAVANETGQRIAAALARLPDAQREVFVLHHYTRLSYEEIADATGVPLGTVKSRMNAALTQLRSLLATLS
jgi:RNA polymerase sigma-70 factor (ECF subfamily)